MSTYSTITVANALTDFALKYRAADMIADMACPVVAADRKKFKYWKFAREDVAKITDAEVAPTGDPNRRHYTVSLSSEIEVIGYALMDYIPLSDLEQADEPMDLEIDTMEDLVGDLLLARELRVATLLTTAGSYASANKVTLGTAWTSTSSTPIADIQTGMFACAMPPNVMILDQLSWDALRRHPSIIGSLRSLTTDGLASEAEVGGYFGFEKILVGKAKRNTADPGQTSSFSTVWPQGKVVIGHIPQDVKGKQATLCRTWRSSGVSGKGPSEVAQGAGISTAVWTEEKKGTRGVAGVKASLEEVSALVAADCGYLISSAA